MDRRDGWAPDTGIWTYRGTVPGHDDNGHVIFFAPMKKFREARIELAFCGNRKKKRTNLASHVSSSITTKIAETTQDHKAK